MSRIPSFIAATVSFGLAVLSAACVTAAARSSPTDTDSSVETARAAAERDHRRATLDPQQYVGLVAEDLLFDLPEPLLPRGERILDDAEGWGVVAVGIRGGGELVLLDRKLDAGGFRVVAVLELPVDVDAAQVAWADCALDGRPATRLVAVVPADGSCEPPGAPAERAWRADPVGGTFQDVPADGVSCLPPMCERPIDGLIEGGVPGSIFEE